ncbi:unnamed protein product [Mucor hiemalis]
MQKEGEGRIYCNSSSLPGDLVPNNVMRSEQPDFSDNNIRKKENPAACIFVASLNKNVPDDELTSNVSDHFQQWGKVMGVKVLQDWLKRPYAFVQYELEEDSKLALQEAPGTYINGRSIRCEPARFLHSQLSAFGEIEDITILQPNGKFHYVFVKFKYRDDAIQSYLTLKGADNYNRYSWFVEWASNLDANSMYSGGYGITSGSRYLDKLSIFVGNLHEYVTDEDVKEVFDQYGSITNIQVMRKPYSRQKRVFAFIKYQNEREAASAIEHENGTSWDDKVIRVCYREYSHNPNAYANAGFGISYNNKQAFSYHGAAGQVYKKTSRQQQQQQQQQIMTTLSPPFVEKGSFFHTPYFNTDSSMSSKSTILDNLSTTSGGSMAKSSAENLLFTHDSRVNNTQGIIAAGTFYPVNEDNGLYNTPPYFIADPYTNMGGAAGTAMVYYPYPVQPYYYNGDRANFINRKKYKRNQ